MCLCSIRTNVTAVKVPLPLVPLCPSISLAPGWLLFIGEGYATPPDKSTQLTPTPGCHILSEG